MINKIVFRSISLADQTLIRALCEIDVTIPAEFDSSFSVDESAIQARVDHFKNRFQATDYLDGAFDEQNRLVGFHVLKRLKTSDGEAATIYSLWVCPEHRRRGIARELKTRAENWARAEGLTHLETAVSSKNAKMLELNRALGFEIESFKMKKKLS